MAFQPYPNGFQAVLTYGLSVTQWTNTLWFTDLTPETDNGQELADFLFDWSANNIMPELSVNWQLLGVKVYDMRSSTATIWYADRVPVNGSVSGTVAPVSPALCVTFYSSARGRSGRGRNYVTGFSEDDMGPTSISNPVRVTNIQQAYSTLLSTVQSGPGYGWVVASRQQAGVVLPEIEGFTVLYAICRNATLTSQRRRIARE